MKETAKAETPTRSTSDCAPSRPSITYQSILALQPDAHNPRTHIAQFAQLGSNSDAHEHRVWFEAAAPNSEAPVCPQTLGIVVQHHLFVHFPKQISEFHSPLESGSVGYMVPRVNVWLNRWIEVGRPVPKEAILYLHTASRRSSASARRCR